MRHGSLFSGIGGFDLAAEWVGWENVFQVENDEWCQKILTKNFPNVKKYRDIKDFKGQKGSVDVISGGFPCQPFSHAGKRKGKADDRYLWPEMLRVISEIKPAFVVGENVAGLISMDNGKTLEGIFSDLENEGYEIESFIIPACGVGAWHRRDRIWIIAYNDSFKWGTDKGKSNRKPNRRDDTSWLYKDVPNTNDTGDRIGLRTDRIGETENERRKGQPQPESSESSKDVSNSKSSRQLREKQLENDKKDIRRGRGFDPNQKGEIRGEDVSDTNNQGSQGRDSRELQKCTGKQSVGKGNTQYNKSIWQFEPDVGRVAHGIPQRVDRLKGLGNAIVPQVVLEIFKAIDKLNQKS